MDALETWKSLVCGPAELSPALLFAQRPRWIRHCMHAPPYAWRGCKA